MTGLIGSAALLLLLPGLALGAALLHGPSGYAAVLVPRRVRAGRRHRLAHRRWRARARGRQASSRVPARMARQIRFIDRGRCVNCRQNAREVRLRKDTIQYDHAVPWSWGGLTCIWNCFLLCGRCNKVKGTFFVDDGVVRGRGYGRYTSRHAGAAVYRREMRRRLSPWRMARVLVAVTSVK